MGKNPKDKNNISAGDEGLLRVFVVWEKYRDEKKVAALYEHYKNERTHYSLYLLHTVLGMILFHHLGDEINRWGLLAGVVACMLALAWLVHTQVERRATESLRAWLDYISSYFSPLQQMAGKWSNRMSDNSKKKTRWVVSILLTATLLVAPVCYAVSESSSPTISEAKLTDNITIKFNIPEGYCLLSENDPKEGQVIAAIKTLYAGTTTLLGYMVNCEDLQALKAGTNVDAPRSATIFGEVNDQIGQVISTMPKEVFLQKMAEKTKAISGEEIKQFANPRLAETANKFGYKQEDLLLKSVKTPTLVTHDNVANYSGSIKEETGTASMNGTTYLGNIILSLELEIPSRNNAMESLLAVQKRYMHELVALNQSTALQTEAVQKDQHFLFGISNKKLAEKVVQYFLMAVVIAVLVLIKRRKQ